MDVFTALHTDDHSHGCSMCDIYVDRERQECVVREQGQVEVEHVSISRYV